MLRGFAARFILLAALLCGARATADPDPALRLPRGTRQAPEGHFVSGRGLRDATEFIGKELARRGIAASQIGPYRVRGVELTRFLSETPETAWLAIHVMRVSGKTLIFFVTRPNA